MAAWDPPAPYFGLFDSQELALGVAADYQGEFVIEGGAPSNVGRVAARRKREVGVSLILLLLLERSL